MGRKSEILHVTVVDFTIETPFSKRGLNFDPKGLNLGPKGLVNDFFLRHGVKIELAFTQYTQYTR